MDSPLLTLVIALLFGFLAPIVESQWNVVPQPPAWIWSSLSPAPPAPFPPPPPSAPPPPPPESPPPPPPLQSPPPPPLQSPPPPPPPPPVPPHPPPPLRARRNLRPPPPPLEHGDNNHHEPHRSPSPPPPRKETLNTGKKIGLMFIGIFVILQVGVASFLVIRRRQLLKADNGF